MFEAIEQFGTGEALPRMHPDTETNKELQIQALCGMLDVARTALHGAVAMNVVTPAALAMKRDARWALEQTDPERFFDLHSNVG